jgi:hypothetical protein
MARGATCRHFFGKSFTYYFYYLLLLFLFLFLLFIYFCVFLLLLFKCFHRLTSLVTANHPTEYSTFQQCSVQPGTTISARPGSTTGRGGSNGSSWFRTFLFCLGPNGFCFVTGARRDNVFWGIKEYYLYTLYNGTKVEK